MATFNTIHVSTINSTKPTDGDINLITTGTGRVLLSADPTANLGAATKSYVDVRAAATRINVTPADAATYTILTTDTLISCRYSQTGTQVLTLPLASAAGIGKVFHIVDTAGNAGNYNITINTAGGDKINGHAALLLNGNYQSFSVYVDASSPGKWFVF